MLRLALALVLTGSALASPTDDAIARLRSSQLDLQQLRDNGEVRFTNTAAEQRYMRVLRNIEQSILDLGGSDAAENYRGQAVLAIRQGLSSTYASAAIATLPPFVSKDDLSFIETALRQLSSSNVTPALQAFFTGGSSAHSGNQRGAIATRVLSALSSSYVNRVLAKLPAFACASDLQFCEHALGAFSSSNVEPVFGAYFAHLPAPLAGNARGAIGILISQKLSSSYVQAALGTIPAHVRQSDVPSVQQLIDSTSSSNVVQALREFFGTKRD